MPGLRLLSLPFVVVERLFDEFKWQELFNLACTSTTFKNRIKDYRRKNCELTLYIELHATDYTVCYSSDGPDEDVDDSDQAWHFYHRPEIAQEWNNWKVMKYPFLRRTGKNGKLLKRSEKMWAQNEHNAFYVGDDYEKFAIKMAEFIMGIFKFTETNISIEVEEVDDLVSIFKSDVYQKCTDRKLTGSSISPHDLALGCVGEGNLHIEIESMVEGDNDTNCLKNENDDELLFDSMKTISCKELRIEESNWLNHRQFLDLNCEKISIIIGCYSVVDSKHINQFVKKWISGGYNKLKELEITSKSTSLDMKTICRKTRTVRDEKTLLKLKEALKKHKEDEDAPDDSEKVEDKNNVFFSRTDGKHGNLIKTEQGSYETITLTVFRSSD